MMYFIITDEKGVQALSWEWVWIFSWYDLNCTAGNLFMLSLACIRCKQRLTAANMPRLVE